MASIKGDNIPSRHLQRDTSSYNYRTGRSSRDTSSLDSRGKTIVQLEGWLEKQGHLRKNWKKRYFVKQTITVRKNNYSGVEELQDGIEECMTFTIPTAINRCIRTHAIRTGRASTIALL